MGAGPYGPPPGNAPSPYGAPGAGAGAYGAPVASAGAYGAPVAGAYGAPPAIDGAPNFGAQQPMVGMGSGAIVPHQGYGAPVPRGNHGPVGNIRNPIVVLLLGYVCFFYLFFVLWSTLNELKAFRQRDDLNPIMFFLPIIGILEMLKLPAKVLEAKQMAGVPNAQVVHPVLYLFLWPYFFVNDLNEVWTAAGGGPQQ
jgi:hypothetical protein